MDKKKKNLIVGIVIYFASAALAYLVFTKIGGVSPVSVVPPSALKTEDGKVAFDDTLPKTQICPLNGAKYSKQQEAWWKKHRPLGVMIENTVDARPQSGLSAADVIYEAIAEGGITRFLVVYYCRDAGQIGPVRSARTYFLDFISEYGENPLYAHVGGANTDGPADAIAQIEGYGWRAYNDLDQFGNIPYPIYERIEEINDRPVATEHTMFSNATALWDYAKNKRKLSDKDEDGQSWDKKFVEYSFKDDAKVADRPAAQSINFEFWDGYSDFAVVWSYDPKTNSYLRKTGGEVHTDRNTKKQLSTKNVVVLFMRESRANDGYEGNLHMLYGTRGSGKASVFMDGKEIKATWTKKDRTSRLILKDSTGTEIKFDRGLIWFEIVATGTSLIVK